MYGEMEDFRDFIEQNQPVKDYLSVFPKQLMLLTIEGKVARFTNDNSIIINYYLLEQHLKSPESIFEISTVLDFLETLNVLGFSRNGLPEKKEQYLSYRFWHPSFKSNEPVPDELFKVPVNKINNIAKNQKRMTFNHNIQVFHNILSRSTRLAVTRAEFAQIQLNFALTKKIDELRKEVIYIDLEDPEYKKNGDIAGYYGHNVSLDELKEAFQNFFPIFGDEPKPAAAPEDLNMSGVNEIVISGDDFDVPKRKKRKIDKETVQSSKEIDQALMFLHKESTSGANKSEI